jgi:hypothetical protein
LGGVTFFFFFFFFFCVIFIESICDFFFFFFFFFFFLGSCTILFEFPGIGIGTGRRFRLWLRNRLRRRIAGAPAVGFFLKVFI